MTPELKAKLLRYANECEPFTAHNHIEITDIGFFRVCIFL